jgi:hypothetical protein
MGENTYNHIFGGNDSTLEVTQRSQLAQQSCSLDPADLSSLFRGADRATGILLSAIKTNLNSPGQRPCMDLTKFLNNRGIVPCRGHQISDRFSLLQHGLPATDPGALRVGKYWGLLTVRSAIMRTRGSSYS